MDRASVQERFGIIGTSPAIHHVVDRMRQVATTDISVLIEGESGVGKELIAQGIHALSARRHKTLTIVNCGAIPEGLIESELFGAEKGAYTGAVEKRNGYFEEADGSTIFLDEVGEMPQAAQVRLLRVLESGEFSRIGASTVQHTDVRVIAATNKNLAREVEGGRFREDLYYRLSTVLINVPPLRDRSEDILPIFESFTHRLAQEYNASMKSLTDEAKALLTRYRWPGNVRELRNVAEQVVVLLRNDAVTAEDIEPYLRGVSSQKSLMPVANQDSQEDVRERELLYRMLLEMRLEMRGLKEQIARLASSINVAVPRDGDNQDEEGPNFIIVRGGKKSNLPALIEDASYEIENDRAVPLEGPPRDVRPSEAAPPHRAVRRQAEDTQEAAEGQGPDTQTSDTQAPNHRAPSPEDEASEMPTLEDAERRLIAEALERFDGNRRQTAEALGISERTLYRKLKDVEDGA